MYPNHFGCLLKIQNLIESNLSRFLVPSYFPGGILLLKSVKPVAQMHSFLICVLEGKEFVPSEDKCIFCPGGGQGYVHCVVLTAIHFPSWIPHWPP